MESNRRILLLLERLAFVVVLSAIAGCTSIPAEPFNAFANAAVAMHQGSESALATLVPMSEARFLKEVQTDPEKLEQLMLGFDPQDPLAFTVDAYFLKAEQFRNGTGQATQAFVSYAELLQQLASPELLPQKTFDDLATDLNANAFAAVSTMRTDSGGGAVESVGLFSEVAIVATHAYLESKRRAALATAIAANQPMVDHFSSLMAENVSLVAVALNNEYQARAQEYLGARDSDSFAALDRGHIRQLQALRALSDAFVDISKAHASLASAVRDDGGAAAGITSLLESAKRLQASYDHSLTSNRSVAAQAKADAALARAAIARSEAESLALRAASANVKAVESREAAKANPGDAAKEKKAADLDERASELRLRAGEAAATAEVLEAAAQQVQQAADAIKKSNGGSS